MRLHYMDFLPDFFTRIIFSYLLNSALYKYTCSVIPFLDSFIMGHFRGYSVVPSEHYFFNLFQCEPISYFVVYIIYYKMSCVTVSVQALCEQICFLFISTYPTTLNRIFVPNRRLACRVFKVAFIGRCMQVSNLLNLDTQS